MFQILYRVIEKHSRIGNVLNNTVVKLQLIGILVKKQKLFSYFLFWQCRVVPQVLYLPIDVTAYSNTGFLWELGEKTGEGGGGSQNLPLSIQGKKLCIL